MSAECSTCGADLVYGEYPEMFCQVCDLRDELARLREASTKDRQTILLQNAELARLCEKAEVQAEMLEMSYKELARLREESDDWQKKAILHWSVREDLEAENARLREELEDATEMLVWAYQWVDPHKHVAVDIAEFLRARNAPKETT